MVKTMKDALNYYQSISSIMKDFCQPLNDYLGISLFLYFKIYENSRYIYLSNDINLTQQYITTFSQENFYFREQHFRGYLNNNSVYTQILWPNHPQSKSMEMYINNGYWHGLIITEQDDNSITFYDFLADKNNSGINEFYVQHSTILEKFVEHFKIKFTDNILTKLQKYLVLYEKGSDLSLPNLPKNKMESNSQNIRAFLKATGINTGAAINGEFIHLTERERQCLKLMDRGHSSKSISRELLLSPRTIETHINNIKQKTGYHYKYDLIQLYRNSL